MGETRKLAVILFNGPTERAYFMTHTLDAQLADLKLQIDGLDKLFYRRVLFDGLYASFPKDPEAKVQIYTAEICPRAGPTSLSQRGDVLHLATGDLRSPFRSSPRSAGSGHPKLSTRSSASWAI
jgi:hypothetical protein